AVPGAELVLYADWESARERARAELADADAGMTTSYCPDAVAATDLLLEGGRALPVFYDLDTPVTLGLLARGEAVPWLPPARGLADFRLVFSYTGGPAPGALRQRLGARRVVPLYGHADPALYRPVPPAAHYRADLSYLGTYAADRQSRL
ncbi:MAG: glycosyltransferase, partial [Alphaproteobacteria bacterium]|nr:glycosyltransferase [Alphaproteobacteria bacterium]